MEGTRKITKNFQITAFSIQDTISKTLKLLLKRVIRWECKSTYALDIPAKYLTQWYSTQFRLRVIQKFRLFRVYFLKELFFNTDKTRSMKFCKRKNSSWQNWRPGSRGKKFLIQFIEISRASHRCPFTTLV